jgi:Flp pilus assembly pilin Flp
VEYAVLLALILVGVIVAITSVGNGTGNMWGGIETQTASAGLGK